MDVFGAALTDYFNNLPEETLWLHNSYDTPEEMPIDVFFRNANDMPDLELAAIAACKGRILDIGAGAGSHALVLQARGKDVTALDISPAAATIMRLRNVKKVIEADLFTYEGEQYDTLLFMMNGIGITGTLNGFISFLDQANKLLKPGGKLLFDSSDIAYLYQQGIERPRDHYYGEVRYKYVYKNMEGTWFPWLYIDQTTLKTVAAQNGWNCSVIFEDENDQFLAELIKA